MSPSIKWLPVIACIFILTSGKKSSNWKKKDYYANVTGALQQLGNHVLELERKVETLTDIINNAKRHPMDCEDVREQSQEDHIESGPYLIQVPGFRRRHVYCNFTGHESWTTISRRIHGEDIFNKSWVEYKYGFGNASRDYWIGNEMLHKLTSTYHYYLRITMTRDSGKFTSIYKSFKVDHEILKYSIQLEEYDSANSNGGDGFLFCCLYKKEVGFSTYNFGKEKDRCKETSGGWWYAYGCACSNLNGKHVPSLAVSHNGWIIGIYWRPSRRKDVVHTAVMEMRRY